MPGSTGLQSAEYNRSRNRHRSFKRHVLLVENLASAACAREYVCLLRGSLVAASFRVFIAHCLPSCAHPSHPSNYPFLLCVPGVKCVCLFVRWLSSCKCPSYWLRFVFASCACRFDYSSGRLFMGGSKRWVSRQHNKKNNFRQRGRPRRIRWVSETVVEYWRFMFL